MRTHHLAVGALTLSGLGCASAGIRNPELRSNAAEIRTVAVARFDWTAPHIAGKIDEAGAKQIAESIRKTTFAALQKRQDDGKLSMTLQPIAETDERLACLPDTAHTDRVSSASLAGAIGADAVLYGVVTEYEDPPTGSEVVKSAVGFLLGGALGAALESKGGKVTVVYTMYRSETNQKIWEYTQSEYAGALKGPGHAVSKFGPAAASAFPLKR